MLYPSLSAWLGDTATPGAGRRSAPLWLPNGLVVIPNTGLYYQLFSARPGRTLLVIINRAALAGGHTILVNPNRSPQSPSVPIAAGGVLSLATEGEIWIASTSGSILDSLEFYWPIVIGGDPEGVGSQRGSIPYVAPLLP